MNPNIKFWVGMFASIFAAVASLAPQVDPPYDKILMLAGLVGTAINGVLIQRGRDEWDFERRETERDRIAGFRREDGYPPLPYRLHRVPKRGYPPLVKPLPEPPPAPPRPDEDEPA